VSPPPPRGRNRGGDDDFEDVLRRRKRRRSNGKGKRKRRTTLILGALLIVVLAVIASGVGAVAAFRSSCDLTTLRPVEIGQNSFVFAANGSLLGSIPAERNRAPALAPNTGIRLTASTTAKVITSIAMPSTEMAARSPLSLRS